MHHWLYTLSSLRCYISGCCSNQSPLIASSMNSISYKQPSDTYQGDWSFILNAFVNPNFYQICRFIQNSTMEFEKCQQTTPTTYSEVHYGNREVSTPLGMDFAVSANAPVGFVLILTWNAATFTF